MKRSPSEAELDQFFDQQEEDPLLYVERPAKRMRMTPKEAKPRVNQHELQICDLCSDGKPCPEHDEQDAQMESLPQLEEQEDDDLDFSCHNENDNDNESMETIPETPEPESDEPKNKHRSYFLTLNNYTTVEDELFQSLLKDKTLHYITFGYEIGTKNKVPHIHSLLNYKNPKAWKAIKKLFPRADIRIPRDVAAVMEYCQKDGNYKEAGKKPLSKKAAGTIGAKAGHTKIKELINQGKTYLEIFDEIGDQAIRYKRSIEQTIGLKKIQIEKDAAKAEMLKAKLREWQADVLKLLEQQDERKILWIFDKEGNHGKTWLAKYLLATKDAMYVDNSKKADAAYAWDGQDYIVFDFTRQQEEHINYGTIEGLKNGIIFSSKYESTTKYSKKIIKIIIMANWKPNVGALSMDRWQLIQLDKGKCHEWSAEKIRAYKDIYDNTLHCQN